MNGLETFIISFVGSFLGTVTAFTLQYYLYKKQTEQMEKLKRSLKTHFKKTVQKLKDE